MKTTDQTAGQSALAWIQSSLAAGQTVYVSTMTRATAVKPSTVSAWDRSGRPLFKLANGDLFMASGRQYVKLTIGQMRLVHFSAN
jgi:hypothetical protein